MGSLPLFVWAALVAQPSEPPTIPQLTARLRDTDSTVRQYAAMALCNSAREALSPLTDALGDQDKGARAAAAYGLGLLGVDALPIKSRILKATEDLDVDVRRQATYAMYKLLAAERDRPAPPPPSLPAPVPVFPAEPPAK